MRNQFAVDIVNVTISPASMITISVYLYHALKLSKTHTQIGSFAKNLGHNYKALSILIKGDGRQLTDAVAFRNKPKLSIFIQTFTVTAFLWQVTSRLISVVP